MPTIFESLSQSLTPDMVGQIGKAVGLDTKLVSQGMGVVGPLVTGALANQTSTGTGLDSLMKMLPAGAGAVGLSSILGSLVGGGTSALQSNLFGSGASATGATLDKALGFKVSSLLPLAAPLVLNFIRQKMTTENMDAQGVTKLLQDEHKAFAAKGDETAVIVKNALDAGTQAAATKAKYAAEAWEKVRLAPVAAAQLVIGSDPSGAVGTVKEVTALSKAIAEAKKDASPTSILFLAFDNAIGASDLEHLGKDAASVLATLKDAMGAVSAYSPAEKAGYGKFLVDIASKVAEASKEGGFMGIGGTRVSVAEQAAINQIKAITGYA